MKELPSIRNSLQWITTDGFLSSVMRLSQRHCVLAGSALPTIKVREFFIRALLHNCLQSVGKARSPNHWTILQNQVLGNDALAARGYDLGIDKCIFVAGGTHRKTPKMVATALEAIVGTVFQDGGDEAVTRLIEHLGFFDHRFLTVTSQSLLFSS
jgi:dsRNA-specific ribonuclease